MVSLQPTLITLLNSLPPSPFEQKALNELVEKTLNESKNNSSPENRKSQWEYLLKNEVFKLAVRSLTFPFSTITEIFCRQLRVKP